MAKIDASQAETALPQIWKRFVLEVDVAAMGGLMKAVQLVKRTALPLTPIQYQGLRDSARTEVEMTSKGATAIVGFGRGVRVAVSPNTPSGIVTYAIHVHEDIEKGRAPGTGPGYLSKAANRTQGEQKQKLVEVLRRVSNRSSV